MTETNVEVVWQGYTVLTSNDNVTSTEIARRKQDILFLCTISVLLEILFVEWKLNNDMRISTNSEIVLNYSLASKQGKFSSCTVVFASYETIFN